MHLMLWARVVLHRSLARTTTVLLFLVVVVYSLISERHGAAQEDTSASTPSAPTSTPVSPDPTVTALGKEKLQEEVNALRRGNERNMGNWLWSNATTIVASILSAIVTMVVAGIGIIQYFRTQRYEKAKVLDDRKEERTKRAEERFKSVTDGLSSKDVATQVGGAVMLRTFVTSDYSDFHPQAFDLTVSHLRLQPLASNMADPLAPVARGLAKVLEEVFPHVRDRDPSSAQRREGMLDASGVYLHRVNLAGADLERIWMPESWLTMTNLTGARLTQANLRGAKLNSSILRGTQFSAASLDGVDLTGAVLTEANLEDSTLVRANLSDATLIGARLNRANLTGASLIGASLFGAVLDEGNLYGASLLGADFTNASLRGVNLASSNPESALSLAGTLMRGATGLSDAQIQACAAKGAIF